MLENIKMAPPDPILGLSEAFNKDPNEAKINLGVGVYKDENGVTPTLACIVKAEKVLAAEQTSGGAYLPMTGLAALDAAVVPLLFGAGSNVVTSGRALAAQTPGGTGGLRIAGDFIRRTFPGSKIWISDPTWANHKGIFSAAGIESATYPYYDERSSTLAFDAMVAALREVPAGDVVLFHACCHNPSGMDPTPEQWRQLADLARDRKFLPFFDFAYQGFGGGLDEDAFGVRAFVETGVEMLVASSFSKNFGLYNQRVGALTLVAANADAAKAAMSHVKMCIRTNYSNPPAHGARLVATVLGDAELRRLWVDEVAAMRGRINSMRKLFVTTMAAKTDKRDFSFIAKQNGMFSFAGLTKEQVHRLRDDYAIYIVDSGRISVAGITAANMDALCSAIAAVV